MSTLMNVINFVVLPDLPKMLDDIRQGHPRFATVKAPKIILPSKRALERMRPAERAKREAFWLTFLGAEYVLTATAGSVIMAVPKLKKKLSGSSYKTVTPEETTSSEPATSSSAQEGQARTQRMVVASAFSATYLAAASCTAYSVQAGTLSKTFGFDFEVYAGLLAANCTWQLIQAVVAVCACKGDDEYEVHIFAETSAFGNMPFVSDGYDTVKDFMFIGLCLRSQSAILHGVGVLSMLWLLGVHVGFILNDEIVSELTASYASVLYARKQRKNIKEEDVSMTTSMEMKAKIFFFTQTAPGKQQVLLFENGPQAVGAVVYLLIEGGSPVVATLNLAIPVVQYVAALSLHPYFRRQVATFLLESYGRAISDGQLLRAQIFNKQIEQAAEAYGEGWRNYDANSSETPLHRAAQVGDVKHVQILVESGADVNARDDAGETPLKKPVINGYVEVINVLMATGKVGTSFFTAADADGQTPLHIAVEDGDVKRIKGIIAAGADVNLKNKKGESPFKNSVDNGQVEVIEVLLATGNADGSFLTAKDGDGKTLLHRAAQTGDVKHVRAIIAAGADVNAKDFLLSRTPLFYAKNADVAEMLLKAGADANSKDDADRTPLHLASINGHAGVAELLLKAGARANAKSYKGYTPLHVAINADVSEVLLKAGADANSKDEDGYTPLHKATNADVAEVLLKAGADVNAKNQLGWTPLHFAGRDGHAGVAEVLLKAGADANSKDNEGFTPLHLASTNGQAGIAEALLKAGADANAKITSGSSQGETPLDLAGKWGGKKEEIKALLRRYGGR